MAWLRALVVVIVVTACGGVFGGLIFGAMIGIALAVLDQLLLVLRQWLQTRAVKNIERRPDAALRPREEP